MKKPALALLLFAAVIALFAATLLSIRAGGDPGPDDPWPDDLTLTKFATHPAFADNPIDITHADDGSGRLFWAGRFGEIYIVTEEGEVLGTPFLDIKDRVKFGQWELYGLLGLAFPPEFSEKGWFYVFYTRTNAQGVDESAISRFRVSATDPNRADPASEQDILVLPHDFPAYPQFHHWGGEIAFGPHDGYLYIAIGDAGCNRPCWDLYPQNPENLWGSLLRIDTESSLPPGSAQPYLIPPANPFTQTLNYRPEIYAYGLRNPWHFAFDRKTGDLFIGDVQESIWEEIDFIAHDSGGGQNFGWPIVEGSSRCLPYGTATCDTTGLTPPIHEYLHEPDAYPGRCSVVGGHVYRGGSFPRMAGTYFFSDWCDGDIVGLRLDPASGQWVARTLIEGDLTSRYVAAFGEDEQGNLYVGHMFNGVTSGSIWLLQDSVRATATPSPSPPVTATPTTSPSPTFTATPPPSLTPTPTEPAQHTPPPTATPAQTATSTPVPTATLTPTTSPTSTATPLPRLYLPLLLRAATPGLPPATAETSLFSASGRCTNCHTNNFDAAGNDVSIDRDWRSSVMANSAKDPIWQAKVSAEVQRFPAESAALQELCSRCHMPMAHTQAVHDGDIPAILPAANGFLDPDHPLHDIALDGVSCTACHQISSEGLGENRSYTGRFVIDAAIAKPDRPVYGPFDAAGVGLVLMRGQSGFIPAESQHILDSGLCGTCHTLFTGGFPEQATYLEWEHSVFARASSAQSCQHCHMPAAEGGVSLYEGFPAREPFGRHVLVGGNTVLLDMFGKNVDDLGLRASAADFTRTLQQTINQLRSDTAALTISDLSLDVDTLTASLTVKNYVGHKFPSGYPARRAWLHFTVRDQHGRLVFQSGAWDEQTGISGNAAAAVLASFEPHYTTITAPGQVQIYESVMGDAAGSVTYDLSAAAAYLKDNRLLPPGFDKTQAESDIAVVGAALADADFRGGIDRITYAVDVSGHEGPFTVEAELLYQPLGHRFVADLTETDTPEVRRFSQLYARADITPVVVAFDTATSEP